EPYSRRPRPCAYPQSSSVKDGAFLAYGPRQEHVFRRIGQLAGKVLRGTNPAELPVEQPTRFELAVNLRVAKELGITLSPTFLLRADQVIE
ncbi:ABC transporter substrate binding protein, partial [Bradyrhizobium macuxiense]|uniref:ABC transporter substrate binding protein n=1 Tax=Bradyrhizobium macuxiense TaxID=1755647 RepID=UPI0024C047F3